MKLMPFTNHAEAQAYAADAIARGCGAVIYLYPDGSAQVGTWDVKK